MEQAIPDRIHEDDFTSQHGIHPGDVVALRSGGPDMTVLQVHAKPGDPMVADLGWFTAVGEYRTGTLPVAVLVSVGKDDEVPVGIPSPCAPALRKSGRR